MIKIESLLLNRESICSDGRHLICDRPTFSCHRNAAELSLLYLCHESQIKSNNHEKQESPPPLCGYWTGTASHLFTYFPSNSWYSACNNTYRWSLQLLCHNAFKSYIPDWRLNRYNLIMGASAQGLASEQLCLLI